MIYLPRRFPAGVFEQTDKIQPVVFKITLLKQPTVHKKREKHPWDLKVLVLEEPWRGAAARHKAEASTSVIYLTQAASGAPARCM